MASLSIATQLLNKAHFQILILARGITSPRMEEMMGPIIKKSN